LERIIGITIGLILLTSLIVVGQEQDFKVGFKIISACDSSRSYKPNSPTSDKLHYRPVDIDVWYPADIASTDSVASFVDFVNLFEQRSKFYDDTRTYDGLTDELLQYICSGINCEDVNSLRKIKTESYVSAKPVNETFPLVIYLAGLNGMSYENYLLFEALAKKGFVVASVSSIGRYPGNMTMDSLDLFEQINDAKFIARHLMKEKFILNEIGVIGYSWGGLTASVLAMGELPGIMAVVSLDGSEQFVYTDEDENESLAHVRNSSFFKPEAIHCSFLYLDSDFNDSDVLPDSIYNITDVIPGDKFYMKLLGSTHDDFSSLSILAKEKQSNSKYSVIQRLTINYLLDKLKGEDFFYKNIPNGMVSMQFSQPVAVADAGTGKKILKGVVRDKKTSLPLPYVNVGILNKDRGTITNSKGEFELSILDSNKNDTLKVSMIGYASRVMLLGDILKKKKLNLNIQLQEQPNELKEVVITGKQLTTKVLGNETDSKFLGAKFAPGDLGSEIAIKIKIKNDPTYLDTFSFNISFNTEDTATFRVNIYEAKDDFPGKNILTDNIILKLNGETGKIETDLKKYDMVVKDDIFIALEWVGGRKNSGIVFSAGLLNKGTYYRKGSQGRWRKAPIGVGLNITARY
jgi:hypothetical protein